MFKNIKRLKALEREFEKELKERGDEPNNEIKIHCDDLSEAISPFCGDTPIINGELGDYLENKAQQLPLDADIHISIDGNADKATIERGIRNYYNNKLSDSRREFKKNSQLASLFTLLAVVILTAAVLIGVFLPQNVVLGEIVDIAGWVFMWEAVDIFFIQRGSLRIDRIRYLNFARAKID